MVGGAIIRRLLARGFRQADIVTHTRAQLDLTNEAAVESFFADEKPTHVYLAAAHVGGIHANNSYPAEFIRDNLAIQTNVIHCASMHAVERLLFLGSSCVYPKLSPQPITEDSLLTGPLEPTNRPYAIAKIAGIEMCWSYNRQRATQFLAVMPTNLYGLGDNYHPENSHVIPALIRRFHEAALANSRSVAIWGSGDPRREFMFADDMADACVHIMNLPESQFRPLLAADRNDGTPPTVNIGMGADIGIADLAVLVAETVGFKGLISYDRAKPDGTLRKLLDSSRLHALGWRSSTPLDRGLAAAYSDFVAREGLDRAGSQPNTDAA